MSTHRHEPEPTHNEATTMNAPVNSRANTDPRTVWVVHGRDAQAHDALFQFLRAIDLKPIEWNEASRWTNVAAPQISQILEQAFSRARAVVVLLTPDDFAYLRPEFVKHDDKQHEREPTGQARPNVLFEAGMAFGIHPTRTILVCVGSLRPFSNIDGRHMVKMDNSTAARQELAQRLQTAGCAVDLSGVQWHTAGTFEIRSEPHTPPAAFTNTAPVADEIRVKTRTAYAGPHLAPYVQVSVMNASTATLYLAHVYFQLGDKRGYHFVKPPPGLGTKLPAAIEPGNSFECYFDAIEAQASIGLEIPEQIVAEDRIERRFLGNTEEVRQAFNNIHGIVNHTHQ
ncbi:MAG: TIR domain-containing protein [Planctomycetota bacterium]